jgi:hypothetical protein
MALAHRSGGWCYWPGCMEKVLKDEAGEPFLIAEIAHIHGAYPGSARYTAEMIDDQRRSFSNLMLFCGLHHSMVDQDERGYPAEKLRRWKAEREAEASLGAVDVAGFVAMYRSQVCVLHGYLELPNFERSDRLPAADLYVLTQRIREVPGPGRPLPPEAAAQLTVADLPRLAGRAVLLGDPGGGKTTAARMLMHSCASDPAARTPFLVELGAYAAAAAPGCSIVEYVESDLRATYGCRPPDGLVDRLLRAGAALVIFDGLDELLDGAGRRGISRRIELFCQAYPRAPVLITSRVIGYNRARLNGDVFTCYRLAEFTRPEAEEYVRRRFADPATAAAFLDKSAGASDLRSNPLFLSLMCSLYQDERALPASRAGLYERCADLLLRTWDKERGIGRKLPAGVEVRALIRHLAWRMLRERLPVIRENPLLAAVTEFLQARGFGCAEEAQDAAEEFIEFCRERTWVLSPAVTAKGERGYGFTHRTFLEYYAAAYIATDLTATPEELAEFLARRVADDEWTGIDLLAVAVMECKADGTAERVCEALLEQDRAATDRGGRLAFLACLPTSTSLSSVTAQKLIREALPHRIRYEPDRETQHPLSYMMALWAGQKELISSEISSYVGMAVASGSFEAAEALHLLLDIAVHDLGFWSEWAAGQASRYTAEITAASVQSGELRTLALHAGLLTLEQAIEMPGGLNALMQSFPQLLHSSPVFPYPADHYLMAVTASAVHAEAFATIGRYVTSHPELPLARAGDFDDFCLSDIASEQLLRELGAELSEIAGLGLAAVHAICSELFSWPETGQRPRAELPMPSQYRSIFRDWADGTVDLTEA